MKMELVLLPVILTLLALVVWQQIFWARQVQQLVDKLMSKSFIEYKQASEFKQEPNKTVKVQVDAAEDLGRLA